jgi:hypothetical protein
MACYKVKLEVACYCPVTSDDISHVL